MCRQQIWVYLPDKKKRDKQSKIIEASVTTIKKDSTEVGTTPGSNCQDIEKYSINKFDKQQKGGDEEMV